MYGSTSGEIPGTNWGKETPRGRAVEHADLFSIFPSTQCVRLLAGAWHENSVGLR